jgi:hypothetical protein
VPLDEEACFAWWRSLACWDINRRRAVASRLCSCPEILRP